MTPLYSLLVDLLSLTYKTQLTLQKLVLRGCGGNLKGLDVMNLINSTDSPLKFSQHQSAVLLFLHINTLLINEVTITYYYGFAVFAINPSNTSINHSEISISYGGKHGMNRFGSSIFLFLLIVSLRVSLI